MKVEMTGQIFVKFFSAKFPKYLFSGFQVIQFLQTEGRTDGAIFTSVPQECEIPLFW
jgi:hypothetical protein